MVKQSIEGTGKSIPTWETLEEFARGGMPALMQGVLEEEVAELRGRRKHERRDPVDVA